MISGQDATLNYYYHYALLSVGGELMAAFESSLAPVALSPIVMKAVALGVNEQQIETFLLPVQANKHIPFQGSWLLLNVMTVLFIISTQALALFIFSLFPAVAIIISIVSMVGSLGATLSGVTFPVLNMYPLVRDTSYLFPVRHYTEITQTMLYYGGGFIHLWPSAVILCIFPLLALAMLPHLRRAIISRKYENIR